MIYYLAPARERLDGSQMLLPDYARKGFVFDALRADLPIPVWHDDQQGTAAVVLAALLNAVDSVGKRLREVRIALIGIRAANIAVYRILVAEGVSPSAIVACNSRGT